MNSAPAWEAGQCKLSQGPASRASRQRMGRWLCVYSGISRTIQHLEVPSGPLTRPFLGSALGLELRLRWLSSLSSCLLSRFHPQPYCQLWAPLLLTITFATSRSQRYFFCFHQTAGGKPFQWWTQDRLQAFQKTGSSGHFPHFCFPDTMAADYPPPHRFSRVTPSTF